jgi:hypothetical protein
LKTKFGGKKRRESGDVCGLERERGEPKKKRKRASEAEEKEPRLVRFKFQQAFPFLRLLLKERHPSMFTYKFPLPLGGRVQDKLDGLTVDIFCTDKITI